MFSKAFFSRGVKSRDCVVKGLNKDMNVIIVSEFSKFLKFHSKIFTLLNDTDGKVF